MPRALPGCRLCQPCSLCRPCPAGRLVALRIDALDRNLGVQRLRRPGACRLCPALLAPSCRSSRPLRIQLIALSQEADEQGLVAQLAVEVVGLLLLLLRLRLRLLWRVPLLPWRVVP